MMTRRNLDLYVIHRSWSKGVLSKNRRDHSYYYSDFVDAIAIHYARQATRVTIIT